MVDCKACQMKGRGRRPAHVCERVNTTKTKKVKADKKAKPENKVNWYNKGYQFASYNALYKMLYNGKKIAIPATNGYPPLYANGIRDKIKEVMNDVVLENNQENPQLHKLKSILKPIAHNVLKPKGISQIKANTLSNSNKKVVQQFIDQPVRKQHVDSLFKWVSFKFRKILYKQPKEITLFLKRNGAVDTKHDFHNVSALKHYKSKMKKSGLQQKRFIITKIHILYDIMDKDGHSPSENNWEDTSGYHMNVLVHDLLQNEIYRFEPHGSCSDVTNSKLDTFLKSKLKSKSVRYKNASSFLPFKGPMYYYGPTYMVSALWCLAFMHMRLQYPDMKSQQLFKELGLRRKTSKEFMMKYVKYIQAQMHLKSVLH